MASSEPTTPAPTTEKSPLEVAKAAVLAPSKTEDEGEAPILSSASPAVRGPEFGGPNDTPSAETEDSGKKLSSPVERVMEALLTTGFQATHLGEAIKEVNRMRRWRLSDVPIKPDEDEMYKDLKTREKTKCTIFLAYTSNMISSGVRETIRYLVQHKMVDVLVTTAGGIEEDIIKCLAPTFVGSFGKFKGDKLRRAGVNRVGNLLVPNDNYCRFEDWLQPRLEKMTDEQDNDGVVWTPSKFVERLGREIADESSVYYWAARHNIPVFCPALTDGSIGDMLYFHSYKRDFTLDIVRDVRKINDVSVKAKCTGMIILGGGLVKHHTCNANLMRNGADFAVFINTGQEFDGSDSGARPDEAVSWGKIKIDATPVKVYADATLAFPLLVSQTFAVPLASETTTTTTTTSDAAEDEEAAASAAADTAHLPKEEEDQVAK